MYNIHNSPVAPAKAELPGQFRKRRCPPQPHTSSEESLDLAGIGAGGNLLCVESRPVFTYIVLVLICNSEFTQY